MPVDLAAHARELLARQAATAKALQGALVQAQKQIAYADRVIDISGHLPEPIYFDLEA
jgi:hypothetical protein